VGPALAVLEIRSIARGYFALDALAKRAYVQVLHAEPISPGKFWIAVSGGEAEVEEALEAGVAAAADARLDHTLLPYVHDEVRRAVVEGPRRSSPDGSIGVLEFDTLSSAIRAADAALKCADVTLMDLHLARGIGGKGYLVLCGALSDVEAALEAGVASGGEDHLVGRELLANPDECVPSVPARRGAPR
jgi:microcompartment protein CcmL/EutN